MSRRNIPASPLFPSSPPLPVVRGRVRVTSGASRELLGLGRVCAEAGKEYWGEVPQTARREMQIGIWVRWWFSLGGQGAYQRARCERACRNHASAVLLYLPAATAGCPSSARAGAPVGAKEVYSAPSTRLKASHHIWQAPLPERGVHPASHPKTLEECSTHHAAVLT